MAVTNTGAVLTMAQGDSVTARVLVRAALLTAGGAAASLIVQNGTPTTLIQLAAAANTSAYVIFPSPIVFDTVTFQTLSGTGAVAFLYL